MVTSDAAATLTISNDTDVAVATPFNGKASLIVNSVLRLIAFIMIIFIYFAHEPGNYMQVFWFGVVPLIAAFVLGFLFDMFFGKLVEAIKRQ